MAKEKSEKDRSGSSVSVLDKSGLVTVEILQATFVAVPGGGGHRPVKPGDRPEVTRDEAEHLVMVGKAKAI